MPKISIIVPVYNTENFLQRCVDSIINQTYSNYELILVDDGSTDDSGSICDEYAKVEPRVQVIHQKNKGQAAARNTALDWVFKYSSSRYIAFVDSDDWLHPQYFESLISAAQTWNTRIAACGFVKTSEYSCEKMMLKQPKSMVISAIDDYTRFMTGIYAYPVMRLYSKELWADCRFPAGRVWEDTATIYKVLFLCDKVAWVPDELYFYFINPNGTVLRPWNPSRLDEIIAYEEQLAFFENKSQYVDVYQMLKTSYIKAIAYSSFMEHNSDLPEDEKKYYARILQKKIRKALKKYKRIEGISFKTDKYVFETAYPAFMQAYWFVRSRLDKLKRG